MRGVLLRTANQAPDSPSPPLLLLPSRRLRWSMALTLRSWSRYWNIGISHGHLAPSVDRYLVPILRRRERRRLTQHRARRSAPGRRRAAPRHAATPRSLHRASQESKTVLLSSPAASGSAEPRTREKIPRTEVYLMGPYLSVPTRLAEMNTRQKGPVKFKSTI